MKKPTVFNKKNERWGAAQARVQERVLHRIQTSIKIDRDLHERVWIAANSYDMVPSRIMERCIRDAVDRLFPEPQGGLKNV